MEKKRNWTGKIFRLLLGTMLGVFLCGMCAMARTETVSLAPYQGYQTYTGNWDTYDVTAYHKFVLKKPSVVYAAGQRVWSDGTPDSLGVILCNKNKKDLEKYSQYISDSKTATYVLPKGTYYLKTVNVQRYALVVDAKTKVFGSAIKEGGASKAKAKTLAARKATVGMIGITEKTNAADWYKFRISKSQFLTFSLKASGSGSLRITLYGPGLTNGQTSLGDLKNKKVKSRIVNILTGKKVRVPAGTYYIKVMRSSYDKDKTKGAAYSLYWR